MFLHTYNNSENSDIVQGGAASVVPSKEDLIRNLSGKGYIINQFDDIYALDVTGERIYAKKGNSCIDICYGLNKDDAKKVYQYYEDKYLSSDYYIIARNEAFVYYISDKTVFHDSGFKSTDNVGSQHIKGT